MEKIIESIKHYWTDHKVIAGIVIAAISNYFIMKISESTSVSMPIKNMLAIVAGVIAGVIGYTELTGRLTSLETSRELMLNDLLKASDQKPIDQEQFLIQESLASDLRKDYY